MTKAPEPKLTAAVANALAPQSKPHEAYANIALVLQGGGALGSYQAGVYEGLSEAGIWPNWVAGISIGALNAAVIAGNPPAQRVAQLRAFWEHICRQPWLPPQLHAAFGGHALALPDGVRRWVDQIEAARTIFEGQNGFFVPRPLAPVLPGVGSPTTASYYDTSPLRATLERFADFDRINRPDEMRVSVGAVQVRTGNLVYFDNTRTTLRPEHFMASGALPPGFPAVEVDGELYWDGGLVSNTPLLAAARHAGVPDRPVERARRSADQPGRGGRTPEGHPVFEPHPCDHRLHARDAGPAPPAGRAARAVAARTPQFTGRAPRRRARLRPPLQRDPADLPREAL
jgi:predicted acylesterase/phospholipase RssA